MKYFFFFIGLLFYFIIAMACAFDTPEPCNENVVRKTIHIDWSKIPNYPGRTSPCLPFPGNEPWSPLYTTAISLVQGLNIYEKGYVQLSIVLFEDHSCTLNKDYTSLQYYITPGTTDVVLEVPVQNVYFRITYLEACKTCSNSSGSAKRAMFRSVTLVSENEIMGGGTITLNAPTHVGETNCQ